MSEITQLLQRVNEGDAIAREALFAALYQDLRQLVTSPYRRALQTAEILADILKLPVEIDATIGASSSRMPPA